MAERIRRLTALVPALVLVAGLVLTARPPGPTDICVGAGKEFTCVTPDSP